jgi:hypothetical protein
MLRHYGVKNHPYPGLPVTGEGIGFVPLNSFVTFVLFVVRKSLLRFTCRVP